MTMQRRLSSRLRAPHEARGFTLIELLISMTIGLVLIAALGLMMNMFEKSKRQNSTTSDLAQSSGYLTYDLDRQMRSVGSGLFQNAAAFGCPLNAARGGVPILPRASAFPPPFASVPAAVNATPVVVYAGAGVDPNFGNGPSDIIQTMTMAAGLSEVPQEATPGKVQVNAIGLNNTLGMRAGDLLMLTELNRNCLITQVADDYSGAAGVNLPLGGTFYAAAVGVNNIVAYGLNAPLSVTNLGNVNGNQPRFQLLGINANRQLVAYDMLQMNNVPGADLPLPLADNVMDLRVRFGIAGNAVNDGLLTNWVNPADAPYNAAGLNTTNPGQASRIVAISISMLVRGDRIERKEDPRVSPASFTMFSSLPAAMQMVVKLPDDEQRRNYRLVEMTVPVRNAILTAPGRTAPP